MYPIVEYSHIINKNTAEFTLKDFAGYMKWWMNQPTREDIVGRKSVKYNAAMQSRIPVDVEQIDDGEVQELVEQVVNDEIVADMTLTHQDVDALVWGLGQLGELFDYSEMPEVGNSLLRLETDLSPLATKYE